MGIMKLVQIGIVTGALLATATSGCRISNAGYPSNTNKNLESKTKEKIAENIEFLVKNAKENKNEQWRKDSMGLGMQEYTISHNYLYLCLTLNNGKFYSVNYNGLRPYTSSPVTFMDNSGDGPGFNNPGENDYLEKSREGRVFLRINSQSSKESMDIVNTAELRILEWFIKTQLE